MGGLSKEVPEKLAPGMTEVPLTAVIDLQADSNSGFTPHGEMKKIVKTLKPSGSDSSLPRDHATMRDSIRSLTNTDEVLKPTPKISLFSRATFSWLNSTVQLGYKKNGIGENINTSDLWVLPEHMTVQDIDRRFLVLWKEEQARPKPSVTRALWRLIRNTCLWSSIFEIVRLVGSFASPLLVREIIIFIQEPQQDFRRGLILAFSLCAGAVGVAFGKSHGFHLIMQAGALVKGAINSAAFDKALRLSNAARQRKSAGEIVNIMSADADKLYQNFFSFNSSWSAPLQLGISLFLLYQQVADATWVGLGSLLFSFVCLAFIFVRIAVLERLRLKFSDTRVKLMNEMVQGIKIIKFMGWEDPILDAIQKARDGELPYIKKIAYTKAVMVAFVLGTSVISGFITFAAYVNMYPERGLNPANIFTAVALLNLLRWPLMSVPQFIAAFASSKISLERIQALLEEEEISPIVPGPVEDVAPGGAIAVIKDATFSWEPEMTPERAATTEIEVEKEATKLEKEIKAMARRRKTNAGVEETCVKKEKEIEKLRSEFVAKKSTPWSPTLSGINLTINKGELLMVIGRVGSGKTSLLSALCGEIDKCSGTVQRWGCIGYVSQNPWIRNATVRDNILFGMPYDGQHYKDTIAACCLGPDIDSLPNGSGTEIGERGVNVSGGQKARIQLARAVYGGADTYLLDDPLSAVDTHVSAKLMKDCVCGMLRGSTRVLVTHQVQYLRYADRVIVMEDGKIVDIGQPDEVMARRDLSAYAGENDEKEVDVGKSIDEDANMTLAKMEEEEAQYMSQRELGGLVGTEERDQGAVSKDVWRSYMQACGSIWHLVFVLAAFCLSSAVQEGSDVWLAVWTGGVIPGPNGDQGETQAFWLGIYAAFCLGTMVIIAFRACYTQWLGIQASKTLVQNLAASILKGSMAFFDVTPSGRVLTRFSRDTDQTDAQLPSTIDNYLGLNAWVGGSCVVICIFLPYFTIPFVIMGAAYKMVERYFTPTARELQRLDGVSKAPVVSHFTEMLQGITTVRAFGMSKSFNDHCKILIDGNLRPQVIAMECRRWLDIRLEFCNLIIQFFTALFCILARDEISPQFVGLALTKALSISTVLSFLVVMRTMLESGMNSVERIIFYTKHVPAEGGLATEVSPPATWPAKGGIAFEKFQMRYREGLPLVLKGLSFEVEAGHKIGIVGRTGCGKSSLMAALFRIVEAAGGRICLDGVDIASVTLKALRSAMAIIPQDPVIFSGKLRFNLDPFNQHTEAELLAALKEAQLESLGGLDKDVTEGGENFSMGQRQLIALARVLLRKPKVLMLDEATASVDMETDNLINTTIKNRILALGGTSMLVIAHRLSTVIDSNKVLVLEQGELGEYAPPKELLSNPNSLLSSMVDKMGEQAASILRAQCGATLSESLYPPIASSQAIGPQD